MALLVLINAIDLLADANIEVFCAVVKISFVLVGAIPCGCPVMVSGFDKHLLRIRYPALDMYARRKNGLNATEAVRYTFSTVGMAIWVNSAVLIAGFSVLTFSHFHINSVIGQCH